MLAIFTTSSIANLGIWIILAVAIIALVAIFVRVSGVQIPAWLIQAFWVVAAAVVIILLIIFLVHVAQAPEPMF